MTARSTADFFDLIQPATGWRCLFVLPAKRHYWFQDSAQMAQAALRFDAEGSAVFHGNAAFNTKSRKADNVSEIRALWLDIDTGLGKPYGDARQAYSAFEIWRSAAGIPPAYIVASGGGLHAYWPLRDPVDGSRWLSAAHRLRALAEQHGLAIDPGSTIDAARILRPPGTHNRKILDETGKKTADVGGPPRPVRCGPPVGPYALEDLGALFTEVGIPASAPPVVLGPLPAHLQGLSTDEALVNIYPEQPSDPVLVAAECAQVRRMRDLRGQLPEPDWYAVLGVLAHSGDQARLVAHEWSAGDARYLAADTDAKLTQARNAAGPTTCERFALLNPAGCVGCRHVGLLGSPIQLGRAQAPKPPSALAPPPPADFELPVLPDPFSFRKLQLIVQRKATDDDPSTSHVISEYPLLVDELQETERNQQVSAVFRSWEPMRKEWRDFSINLGEVLGMAGPGKLADRGVIIPKPRWAQFARYVQTMANIYRGTKHYGTRYEQFGWKETPDGTPGFVVGTALLRPGLPPQTIHGTEEVDRRGKLMAPVGSVAEWSRAANALFSAPGLEGHRFMLMCGFASMLYKFTNEAGATFVHATTPESGNGKSTVLEAIGSIFGDKLATEVISRDTDVAKYTSIGVLSNLPVCFDELRFIDPEEAKAYVLQVTLGRDKQRGKAEGGLRNDNLPWSTVHISAANTSLVDTVQHDGVETAQAARIFEFVLALPEGTKTTTGDVLKQTLRENRGTAGRVFIQMLLEKREWIARMVGERMRRYEEDLGAGTDQRFVIRLFACVDVAAVIVKACGLLDFDHRAMMDWAKAVQQGNARQLATDSKVDPGAIIGRMVNDFWAKTLVMPGPAPRGAAAKSLIVADHEPQGELKARYEREGGVMLFEITAVRQWMQKNSLSITQMGRKLQVMGIVTELRARRTLGAGWKKASGQAWCWEVNGQHPEVAEALGELVDGQPENVVAFRGAR